MGAHPLFDVQVTRIVADYLAPLQFQRQTISPFIKEACSDSRVVAVLEETIYAIDPFRHQVIMINERTQKKTIIPMICRGCQIMPPLGQLWCLEKTDVGFCMSVSSLAGERLTFHFFPWGHVVIAFAFHPLLQQVMYSTPERLAVDSWPDFTHVRSEYSHSPRRYEQILPHPHAQQWFTLRYNPSFFYPRTIECWSATLQVLHTIDLGGVCQLALYKNQYLLAFETNRVWILTFDLQLVESLPHPFSGRVCQSTERSDAFYAPTELGLGLFNLEADIPKK